ncbi:arylcarboxylate reductase [Streptomyces sp. RY43-2]|uniref:Arylcarboxylate reductase n=1 Tax=Streptomyces macrolidinus TaxID=2952607 RepID=A0ABT0ZFU1_9ACTN|nr:arylcarboxylate reductase [Streptomyces macrolidinus]MCN9242443.1 arylcarboxylate reductase [Streptomyces macrolidinus]
MTVAPGLPAVARDAQIEEWLATDLDHWCRRVVQRHFHPETGSPYWLRRAAELPFDPRDITRYEELTELGPFTLDTLRTGDPGDLVPRAVPRPLAGRVWESGGTTGTPCRVFYTPDMVRHRGLWRRWSFVTEGFQEGRSWLQATPTGPHLIGNGVWEAAELFAGQVYAIDMDPRWVKRLIRAGRLAEVGDYTTHLLEQIADVLGPGRVSYLNTTPALFQALRQRHPELVAGLEGVRLSGTQITPAMYHTFRESLGGGICGISYGNTFGNAASLPVAPDAGLIGYVPNYPQVTMAVVRKDDWTTPVDYGTVGQVRLTVLHEDLFLPNILERDQAVRLRTEHWPCDGVANVRPLQETSSAPEGLY